MNIRMVLAARIAIAAFGVAAVAIAILWIFLASSWFSRGGDTRAQAADPAIHKIDKLSSLAVPTFHFTIDEKGRLWIPQLGLDGLKNDGTQVNDLWRYDPATDDLARFTMPGDGQVNTYAQVAARGGVLYAAWGGSLYEVGEESGKIDAKFTIPLDPQYVPKDRPAAITLTGLAFTADGTLWLAREGYAALTSFAKDGTFNSYPLPEGYGEPHSLAVDADGNIWMSVTGHALAAAAAGLEQVTSFAITVEFDPNSGAFQKFNEPSGDLAYSPAGVLSVGGGPGGLRAIQKDGSVQDVSTTAGTNPDDHVVVVPNGAVWYTAMGAAQIIRRDADGKERSFSLPVALSSEKMTGCIRLKETDCSGTIRSVTYVGDVAVDAKGNLWFTAAGSPSYVAEIVP